MDEMKEAVLPPELSVLPSREEFDDSAAWTARFARQNFRYEALGMTAAALTAEYARSEAQRAGLSPLPEKMIQAAVDYHARKASGKTCKTHTPEEARKILGLPPR